MTSKQPITTREEVICGRMVMVKVVPMGRSGNGSATKKSADKQTGRSKATFEAVAPKVVKRMERDNKAECKRYTPRAIRKLMRDQLKLGNPYLLPTELDKMVDELLPRALEAYRGKGQLVEKEKRSAEVEAVWTARNTERKRIVAAMRNRRQERQ